MGASDEEIAERERDLVSARRSAARRSVWQIRPRDVAPPLGGALGPYALPTRAVGREMTSPARRRCTVRAIVAIEPSSDPKSPPGSGSCRRDAVLSFARCSSAKHDVDRLRGHDAIRRELSPVIETTPSRRSRSRARATPRPAVGRRSEGADECRPTRQTTSSGRQLGARKERVRRVEQIANVFVRRAHVVRRGRRGRLGRADDRVRSGGKHEEHAAVGRREQCQRIVVADAIARNGDVRAFASAHLARSRVRSHSRTAVARTSTRRRASPVVSRRRSRRPRVRPRGAARRRCAWFTTTAPASGAAIAFASVSRASFVAAS